MATTRPYVRLLGITLLLGFVISLLAALQATVLAQPSNGRAIVVFATTHSDNEIEDFLERHDLRAAAFYQSSNGFSGTYQVAHDVAVAEPTNAARKQAVDMFEQTLQSNLVRIRDFVAKHSEAEVAADSNLAAQERALLNLRSQVSAVLAALRNSSPITYAIELDSPTAEQVTGLTIDPLVQGVHTSERHTAARLRPEHLDTEFHDGDIEALGPSEIRARALTLLDEGR